LAVFGIVPKKELAQADWAEQRNFSPEKYTCPSREAIPKKATLY